MPQTSTLTIDIENPDDATRLKRSMSTIDTRYFDASNVNRCIVPFAVSVATILRGHGDGDIKPGDTLTVTWRPEHSLQAKCRVNMETLEAEIYLHGQWNKKDHGDYTK